MPEVVGSNTNVANLRDIRIEQPAVQPALSTPPTPAEHEADKTPAIVVAGGGKSPGGPGAENLPPPTDPGLSQAEVEQRLKTEGYNELAEKKVNPILHFMSFFWGPMQAIIWIAIGVTAGNSMWLDFGVLCILQFLNGIVAWREEKNAGDAIAALKKGLAPKAIVKRDNKWATIPARELVVGDMVKLSIGAIVPADVVLLNGQPIEVDQAALTGESLPTVAATGSEVYQGSVIKRGEIIALVTKTGKNTFLGRATTLVAETHGTSNLQRVVRNVTIFIIALAFCLLLAVFIYLLARPPVTQGHLGFVDVWAISIVFLVASVPVATPVVVAATLAVGAHKLSMHQVIVTRLSAIEELAGMDVLCSDKTGTLTKNELTIYVDQAYVVSGFTREELLLTAALASRREAEGQDAIDFCITHAIGEHDDLNKYTELHFVPFDPVGKRTEATLQDQSGTVLQVSKGAPQVILQMSANLPQIKDEVEKQVKELAAKGYRTLGVAKKDASGNWVMMGLLPLFDPPRDDTKETIRRALELGIRVKMITGDQTAIAKETSRMLGMNDEIFNADFWKDESVGEERLGELIEHADGFAEVFPEQKYKIVATLQKRGHRVGMTGDGVNDAPALKKADVGVAVSGATDAARAAADIVLTLPGLSVIVTAIVGARKIYQRIKNYIIYRIAASIQLVLFFFFGVIVFNPAEWYGGTNWRVFRLSNIAVLIITVLTDLTTIAIGYDNVTPSPKPDVWSLPRCIFMSFVLGLVAFASTILWTIAALNLTNGNWLIADWFNIETITFDQACCAIWLVLSLQVYLGVLSARTESWAFSRRPGLMLMVSFFGSLIITTFFAKYWWLEHLSTSPFDVKLAKIPWSLVGIAWAWAFVWFLIQDVVKVFAYALLRRYDARQEEVKQVIADEETLRRHITDLHARADKTILSRQASVSAMFGANESNIVYEAARTLSSTSGNEFVRQLARRDPHTFRRTLSEVSMNLQRSTSQNAAGVGMVG